MNQNESNKDIYDVVVVGAGAAGIGVAVALLHAGIEDFVVVDRETVGASFARWPAETRFITPSFPTNSIGMLDINSIVVGGSPAKTLGVEHPNGKQYQRFLKALVKHFELPIIENVEVMSIAKDEDEFVVQTGDGEVRAFNIIWAAGEFQYPHLGGFEGSTLCKHTSTISSYEELEGDDFIVIGGYESGIDIASHLAERGKKVRVFDSESPWESDSSDPSVALSTYSLERMRRLSFGDNVVLIGDTTIESVTATDAGYELITTDGEWAFTPVQPLLAGGFSGSHKLVSNLFEIRSDGFPLLTKHDESTTTPGIFLCGPSVRHGDHIFCFIYKFRQRFAVVAKAIATSLGLPAEALEIYRDWGMYLDDLSICGEDCIC